MLIFPEKDRVSSLTVVKLLSSATLLLRMGNRPKLSLPEAKNIYIDRGSRKRTPKTRYFLTFISDIHCKNTPQLQACQPINVIL
jgi:ethanolamine ammonia-lyase small subunit